MTLFFGTTGLTDSLFYEYNFKKFPDFIFRDHWAHRFFFYEYNFKKFPDFIFRDHWAHRFFFTGMIGIFSQQCYHIRTTGLTDSLFYEYMFKIFPWSRKIKSGKYLNLYS